MDKLLDTNAAASVLGVRPGTLSTWRWRGCGPTYRKVGGLVKYAMQDLEAWLTAQTRTSTSDPGPEGS